MKKIWLLFFVSLSLSFQLSAQKYYAVIISGDEVTDKTPSGENAFWNDAFILNEYLINKGLDKEQIFFLYGNGDDINVFPYNDRYLPLPFPEPPLTDYAATRSNVQNIFNWLATGSNPEIPQMQYNDVLIVLVLGHGAGQNYSSYMLLMDGIMYDTEFASLVKQVPCKKRIILMGNCYSGGFIDNFQDLNTVFASASRFDKGASFCDDVLPDCGDTYENYIWLWNPPNNQVSYHLEFFYHMFNAMRKSTIDFYNTVPSDIDLNGSVSMTEMFQWDMNHNSSSNYPQYYHPYNLGSHTYLDPDFDRRWENTLALTASSGNHPKLVWGNNPDVTPIKFKIYRGATNNTIPPPVPQFYLIDSVSSSTFYYEDLSVITGGPLLYHYYVTTVFRDQRSNLYESLPSNTARISGGLFKNTNSFNDKDQLSFSLKNNFPNPFNPSTTIRYTVPERSAIQIKVYDILGREVQELVNEHKEVGEHYVQFNALSLSSGVYVYSITASNGNTIHFRESKQMILMK